jgi:hypothetical protein
MPVKRKALLTSAALVPLAATLALPFLHPTRPRVGPGWTPQQLCEETLAAGLDYEVKETGPLGAWCLRARGDGTPWEEIAHGSPSKVFSRPGRVRVLFLPARSDPGGSVEEGVLLLRPLFLLGHPDDLRAIAEALR